jgi:death-on-curing protein
MIKIELVINIHELLIEKFGGVHGLRDINALESAIVRPFMTFETEDLYPTPILQATALIESLIQNHPFLDGNKRIGYVMMRFFLMQNKIDLEATQSEKYDFVMRIANGQLTFAQISDWISAKVVQL